MSINNYIYILFWELFFFLIIIYQESSSFKHTSCSLDIIIKSYRILDLTEDDSEVYHHDDNHNLSISSLNYVHDADLFLTHDQVNDVDDNLEKAKRSYDIYCLALSTNGTTDIIFLLLSLPYTAYIL